MRNLKCGEIAWKSDEILKKYGNVLKTVLLKKCLEMGSNKQVVKKLEKVLHLLVFSQKIEK